MERLKLFLFMLFLVAGFTLAIGLPEKAHADEFVGLTTTLDECIAIGLEKNYKLKSKRTELRGVMLQADAIGISLMPKLDLKAGASYTTPLAQSVNIADMFPDSFWAEIGGKPDTSGSSSEHFQSNWGATLSASYPFTTPYVDKAIESELLARKEEVLSIADDARSSITQAYMNALLMQRSQEVAFKSLELADEQYRNAKLRYDNKVAAWFEVIQAEVQVSLATESLEQTKNNLKNSLKALYLTMGLSSGPDDLVLQPGPVEEIAKIIDEINNTELLGFPDAFVDESYTFRQLGYSIQSIENQVQANKIMPELSGFASWTGQDGSSYQEPNTYVLGVNLKFRLYDSGESKNKMEQLRVQQEMLSISQQEFSQNYLNQLEVLSNNLQVSLLTYDTANKTLDAATEGLKIATIGYKEGITTSLELMDSRTQYLNAELNVFAKKVAIFLAYDSIKHSIGYERYENYAVKSSVVDDGQSEQFEDSASSDGKDEKTLFPVLDIGKPEAIPGS
jgi:outer membrane protein TolC